MPDAPVRIPEADNRKAAVALFADFEQEVADPSRRFGVLSLENVRTGRAARLRVTRDGGGEDWFSVCDRVCASRRSSPRCASGPPEASRPTRVLS